MGRYFPTTPRWDALCKRLQEAREKSGLSQAEVAAALGTTQNFVSKSEHGQRRLDAFELADFAALYGTTIAALLPPDSASKIERLKRVAERTVKPRKKRKKRDE